jgi:hypothetical protein
MYSKLKPGDLLHRSKGIVQHAGVYLGDGRVLHNKPEDGAVVTSYNQYAEGKIVNVTSTDSSDLQLLTQRLNEIIGSNQSYSLLANNCEHLASYLIYGRILSPQIQSTTIGGIVGGLIGKRNGNLAYGVILGGLAGLVLSNMIRKYDYHIDGHETLV